MKMNISEKIKNIARINEDKLKLLTINDDFIKQIGDYRKKIGIPISGFNEDVDSDKVTKLFWDIGKIPKINSAIAEILKNYKLSNNFEMSIRLYLLYNKFSWTPLNYSISLQGDYISIEIYKKPTKEEWILIKKGVNDTISAISSKKHKFLDKFNYPDGVSVSRPKPRLERNLKILENSKLLGQKLEPVEGEAKESIYSDANIEAEIFPWGKADQSKKNMGNIRVIRSRVKRYNKRTT